MEGNQRFKIDWASLIVGSKFAVFALFCFVFEGNFPSTSPRRAYIWRGDLREGFFALPLWGAYIWRDLFSEFYGSLRIQFTVNGKLRQIQVDNFSKQQEKTVPNYFELGMKQLGQVQLVTWFNSFQLSLMSETWDQESTKMAAKKRGCSKPEPYSDFTVCIELQHRGSNG